MRGTPIQRGRAYGSAASGRVQASLALYRDVFAHYAGWDWPRVIEAAAAYEAPIAAAHPRYLEEMRGIAEGADVRFADVLALNVRTEVMFAAIARKAGAASGRGSERRHAAGACSAFAVLAEAERDHVTLVGQNWDWKPATISTVVVLEAEQDAGPSYVTIVEAGLLAKAGMNAAGIGLVTNALVTDADRGEPALPFHIVLRAILDAETLPAALDAITRYPRSSAANYLVAHRGGMAVDVEAAPGGYDQVWIRFPQDGILAHTNHFTAEHPRLKDVGRWWMPDSPFRLERLQRCLTAGHGDLTPAVVQTLLRDHLNHPLGLCTHVDPREPEPERDQTVYSVVMDLSGSTMWLAEGQPCEAPYRRIEYASWFMR